MTAALTKSKAVALDDLPLAERADVLLDRALELGALPASIQELLEQTRRDDAEVGPVVNALSHNPSLAAAVLRAANSPAYGQARSIGDLSRAVMLIGMQELHDLVAGSSMLAAFSRPDPLSERMQGSAVLSANLAQRVAATLRAGSPSTAYLSGLLCELGSLACLALDPEFAALYAASAGEAGARFQGEAARYGASTPEIGARILTASALPSEVAEAVAANGLEASSHAPSLGRAVAFARLAAGPLYDSQTHGDIARLRSDLAAVASTVALELAPEQLLDLCLAAAKAADMKLPGELAIRQSQPANDVIPVALPAAQVKGGSRTGLYVALGVAALVVCVLTWMLTK